MKAYSALASILLSAAAVCGQEAQGEFVRSLNVSGAAELDLNTDSGGISVSAGPAGVVKVRAVLKAQRGWPFNSMSRIGFADRKQSSYTNNRVIGFESGMYPMRR